VGLELPISRAEFPFGNWRPRQNRAGFGQN
jgi:hypothetical protein